MEVAELKADQIILFALEYAKLSIEKIIQFDRRLEEDDWVSLELGQELRSTSDKKAKEIEDELNKLKKIRWWEFWK